MIGSGVISVFTSKPEAGAHHTGFTPLQDLEDLRPGLQMENIQSRVQELEYCMAHCMHAGMNACNTAPFFIPARASVGVLHSMHAPEAEGGAAA